jgi:hypothetical protein
MPIKPSPARTSTQLARLSTINRAASRIEGSGPQTTAGS